MFTLQMWRFNVLPILLSIELIGNLKCHAYNAEPTIGGLNLGQLLFYRSDHWNRHPQTRGIKSRNKNGGIKIFSTEVKKIEKRFKKFPIVFFVFVWKEEILRQKWNWIKNFLPHQYSLLSNPKPNSWYFQSIVLFPSVRQRELAPGLLLEWHARQISLFKD